MDICNSCLYNGMCPKEPYYLGFGKSFRKLFDYLSILVLNGQPTRCEIYRSLNLIKKYNGEKEADVFVKENNSHGLIVSQK